MFGKLESLLFEAGQEARGRIRIVANLIYKTVLEVDDHQLMWNEVAAAVYVVASVVFGNCKITVGQARPFFISLSGSGQFVELLSQVATAL